MDQNLDQQDRDWTDLRGNLQHDINDKCKEIEPKVYTHQYEFIHNWMLINNSLLLNYTENSKTLNFQSLKYQSSLDMPEKMFDMKQINKIKRQLKNVISLIFPYTIFIGVQSTVFDIT